MVPDKGQPPAHQIHGSQEEGASVSQAAHEATGRDVSSKVTPVKSSSEVPLLSGGGRVLGGTTLSGEEGAGGHRARLYSTHPLLS